MLEQEIDAAGVGGAQARGEQEVGVAVGEPAVDERAAVVGQRVPGDGVAERGGQQLAEERGGIGRRLEGRLEQGIVRARRHERGRGEQAARQRNRRESRGVFVRIVRLSDALSDSRTRGARGRRPGRPLRATQA